MTKRPPKFEGAQLGEGHEGKKGAVTPEDVQIEEVIAPFAEIYPLIVEDTRGLHTMVKDTFDVVDDDVLEGLEQGTFTDGTPHSPVDARIFPLDEPQKSEAVIEKMAKEGYRPATARELVTFAAHYRDKFAKSAHIVALGTPIVYRGASRVLVGREDHEGILSAYININRTIGSTFNWHVAMLFLGVRIEDKL